MADLPEGIDWSAGIYQLEATDPVIGGPPNLTTRNGMSNIPHQLLANRTQWLKRHMMAFNSTRSITGATVLDETDVGRLHVIVANAAITLPDASAVRAGAALHFVSTAAAASTIAAAGADTIGAAGPTNVASVTIGLRGTLTLVSNGAGTWVATAGSVQLAGSGAFAASIAANGYQRLPTGLILQWGAGVLPTNGATSTSVTVTLPLAWPTALLSANANARGFANSVTGAIPSLGITAATLTTLTVVGDTLNGSVAGGINFNQAVPFYWQAVGF